LIHIRFWLVVVRRTVPIGLGFADEVSTI